MKPDGWECEPPVSKVLFSVKDGPISDEAKNLKSIHNIQQKTPHTTYHNQQKKKTTYNFFLKFQLHVISFG